MTDYIFVFDMDSTITKQEVLPLIAKGIGKLDEMRHLTEATMSGVIPFKQSFLSRVELLKNIPVQQVNKIVSEISLNTNIVRFISENAGRCYIVTGNLDIWISGLMKKIGMQNHCYCSKAEIALTGGIDKVTSVVDKEMTVKQFVRPFVVIGDGDNDSGMAREAQIAIGFGGVRDIAPSLLRNIDYAFFDDEKCADFLRCLL